VATDVLKVKHYAGKFFGCHFFPFNCCVAYAEILAKDTKQIASGEENRPASPPSPQAIFFAQVRTVTADFGVATDSASPKFPAPTVGVTFARTNAAIFEHLSGSLNFLPDATASVCFQVNGLKILSRDDKAFAKLWQSSRHFRSPLHRLNLPRTFPSWKGQFNGVKVCVTI
jgi:hypothetical protein